MDIGKAEIVTQRVEGAHAIGLARRGIPFRMTRRPVVAERLHLGRKIRKVCCDHAALSGGDDFPWMKGEAPELAEPADGPALVRSPYGTGCILNDRHTALTGDRHDLLHLRGEAEQVDDHDRARVRGERRVQCLGINVEGLGLNLCEHYLRTHIFNAMGRGDPGKGGNHDLIPGLQPERHASKVERRGARRCRQGVCDLMP